MSEAAETTQGLGVVFPDSAESARDRWLWRGVLVLLVMVAFSPAIQGGFVWDDPRHVTENKALHDADGLWRIWFRPSTGRPETYTTPQYYPLTHTTYWIEHQLWGLEPAGYHTVNLLLHAGSVLLLWEILRRLNVPGAWAAAAIFGIHPIQVESVAWITERKNVLAGVFFFAALLNYIDFVKLDRDRDGLRNWRAYSLSLLLFVCALLSKTIACSMPAVMLILIGWKRGKLTIRDLTPLIPFFVLGAIAGSVTAWMERNVVRAVGPEWQHSLIEHILIAGRVVWFYVWKLIWPAKLTFSYPRWEFTPIDWIFPVATIVVLSLLFFARHRLGRGPLAAALIYGVTLAPAMGFVPVYPMKFSYVADHFQYLSGVALIVLIVSEFAKAVRRWARADESRYRAAFLVAAVVLVALGYLTRKQSQLYAGAETLWRDTIAKNDRSWLGHYNLGAELLEKAAVLPASPDRAQVAEKLNKEAAEHSARALELKRDYPDAAINQGVALLRLGKPQDALPLFLRAQELSGRTSQLANLLGLALEATGRTAEATDQFALAVELNKRNADARYNHGRMLERGKKLPEAQEQYLEAIRLRPEFGEAHYRIGHLLALSKTNEPLALGHLAKAVELNEDFVEARAELAAVLARNGKVDEAAQQYMAVAMLRPEDVDTQVAIGYLAWEKARVARTAPEAEKALLLARQCFTNALKLDPKNAKAQQSLANLENAEKQWRATAATRRAAATTTTTTTSTTQATQPATRP